MENKSFASSYEKREQEIASIILNIGQVKRNFEGV